ncbi:YceI family protein [Mucilaginibacter flavus]|uniref:YceI family protein n=1 Tax=Mucilaginibacter flavus TaxID=931504 RepID=UPI0025B32602|nr:YceI family protein [Mucilaginibacter flavus]MDN3584659.1 YceI family protein [Mucilaginibacter flavus]
MQETTTSNWKIDPGHSNLQFKIKHMGIAYIMGIFNEFEGQVTSNHEDFTDASVTLQIDATSINTNNKVRDEHLNSDFFFDTAQFPQINFQGQLKKAVTDYELDGELTIRDVINKIKLRAVLTGSGFGRWGDSRIGFELSGEINRKEYGLTFNVLTDAGGVIVGDVVKLQMDVELIKT